MANTKASALTSITGASVDVAADIFYIVDTSVTTSKKILASEVAIALNSVPATQAQQETGTSLITTVTPGRQKYHPSAAKAWVNWDTTGGISASSGVSSVTDNGVGDFTVNFSTAFSSTAYAVVALESDTNPPRVAGFVSPLLAASCNIKTRDSTTGALADSSGNWSAVFYGDL